MNVAEQQRTPLPGQLRLLAAGLLLAVILVAFEVTSIITALPTITDELGGDSLYGLTIAVYTLANMVALVAAGELADRRGPSLPFITSIVVFLAGLLVAAAAPSMVWIVVGRALQGLGTGAFAPITYLLIKRAFPVERQPLMYAYTSAGWVLPSLVAPLLSGWITDTFGWRWVFLGLVPAGVLVGLLAVRPMLPYRPVEGLDRRPTRLPYAVGAAVGIGVVSTGLQFTNMAALAVAVIGGVALAAPNLRLLFPAGVATARVGLPAVIACRMLATATFLGVDSFIPLAADRVHGARPLVQGFVIIGAALTWSLGQWLRARRPQGAPARKVRVGFVGMFVGVLLVAPVLWSGWPLWATFVAWAIGGLGMGALFNPTTVAAMTFATEGREGEVSSQVNLADSVGFSVMGGIGGATVALADRTSWTLTGAIGTNFAMAAVLGALGVIAAGRVRQVDPTRAGRPAG